jgi:L-asparagine oxygenase
MAIAPIRTLELDPSSFPPPVPTDGLQVDDEAFVDAATQLAGAFPADLREALAAFATDPGPAGALLVRNVPTGDVPSTPPTPTSPTRKDRRSEELLLAVARALGEPVGYLPEHGGSIVQNLVPTQADVGRQTSTSSGVDLAFHTETAFHPHGPRYLLLLCLRGDPAAATTLASIDDLLPALAPETVAALRRPEFRTAVDESFGGRSGVPYGPARPVLGGGDEPWLCWDEELTTGDTEAARAALVELRSAVARRRREIVLADGDLLVVDNRRCVHGRRPFDARFDGTDRWLQRTFVVASLVPSIDDRVGRIITTTFDDAATAAA